MTRTRHVPHHVTQRGNPTNRTVSGGIYNHTYDTDDNGNIIQIGSTDYGYDATSNRLTKVNGGTTTTTVPTTSNKISAVGANSYTYDAAGNITDDGTRTSTHGTMQGSWQRSKSAAPRWHRWMQAHPKF